MSARWRVLAVAPLPFILALLAVEHSVVGPILAASLGLASLACAGALWAKNRALRLVACAGHALALALGFGVGAVLALVNEVGGLEGERHGARWASAALGTGALACAAALLPLLALVVWEVRQAGR